MASKAIEFGCYADCNRTAWRKRIQAERKTPAYCWICLLTDMESKFSFGCILDTHHLTYRNKNSERSEDLMFLCRPCHDAVEHFKPSTYADSFDTVIFLLAVFNANCTIDGITDHWESRWDEVEQYGELGDPTSQATLMRYVHVLKNPEMVESLEKFSAT